MISPARVRILLGLPPVKPTAKVEPKKTVTPAHATDVKKAARACVERVKAGALPTRALREERLPLCYVQAVRECVAGGGPITEAARTGDMTKLSPKVGRGNVTFVRWYRDWPRIINQDDPENDRLRKALLKTGLSFNKLGELLDLHPTTVADFVKKRQPRMRKAVRQRVAALVKNFNQL